MTQTLAQLRKIFVRPSKKSTLLISFFLLILIIILYVVQARLGTQAASPTAFLYSNLTPSSVTVSFVTPNPDNVCFVLLPSGWSQVKVACDFSNTRVHKAVFSGLRDGSTYQGMIISLGQLRFWTSVSESVGNRLADITFAQTRLPDLLTPSKIDYIDQTSSINIAGTVVDRDGVMQLNALVVLIKGNDRISSVTNEKGAFSMVVPDSWMSEEVFLLTWSENGYAEYPQPLAIIAGQAQTIEIQPYEF